MEERARRRKAHRAGLDGTLHDGRHLAKIGVGRRLAVRPALAHHVDAHRRMRNVAADIHVVLPRREEIEVLRIRFPGPRQTVHQHRMRDVLDAFHELD